AISPNHHNFTEDQRRRGGLTTGAKHAHNAPASRKNPFRHLWINLSRFAGESSGILLVCDRRRRSIRYGLINTNSFVFVCGDKTMNLLPAATAKLAEFLETGVTHNGLLVSEDNRFVYVFAGAMNRNKELAAAAKELHNEWLRAIRGQYEGQE
ncbi:MAG TPA: hypothetical protein VJB05_03720, partial [archaeon]|nr:hypothetical protein [archaeon]